MSVRAFRPEETTPPATPNALKITARAKALRNFFQGKILSRCCDSIRRTVSEQILRQHLIEVDLNKGQKNYFISHGRFLIRDEDIIDAVHLHGIMGDPRSAELISRVAKESNSEKVRAEAAKATRFTSGIMPAQR